MKKNEGFARLLSEGIASVSESRGENEEVTEGEIADKTGYSIQTIRKWKQGYPPKPEFLQVLVKYCLDNSHMNRVWAERILTAAHYLHPEALLSEIFGQSAEIHILSTGLEDFPPRPPVFLGRDADAARLYEGLDSQDTVISVEGPAGSGKTSLVVEVAPYCLVGENAKLRKPFIHLVWVSGREGVPRLLEEVTRKLRRVTTLDPNLPPAEMRARVKQLLSSQRILIVIDNFEDVKGQERDELEDWIAQVREPSKVLIISTESQSNSWCVRLTELSDEIASEVLRRNAHRLGLPHIEEANEEELLPLVHASHGNPQSIKLALGFLKGGIADLDQVPVRLRELGLDIEEQDEKKSIESIIGITWRYKLSQKAKDIIFSISFFPEVAAKEALGAIVGLQDDSLGKALSELSDSALIQLVEPQEPSTPDGERSWGYSIHPALRSFAEAQSREAMWEATARSEWVKWYENLASRASGPDDYSSLLPELNNLLAVMAWLNSNKEWKTLGRYLGHIHRILYVEGYWEPLLRYTEAVGDWANSIRSLEAAEVWADLFQSYIGICIKISDDNRGTSWWRKAQEVAEVLHHRPLQAEVWLGAARLLELKDIRRNKDMRDELFFRRLGMVRESLRISTELGLPLKIIWAWNTLGLLYLWRAPLSESQLSQEEFVSLLNKADAYFIKALNVLKVYKNHPQILRWERWWNAVIVGNRAHVLGARGGQENNKQARDILETILPKLTDPDDFAEAHVSLAYYEYLLGNKDEAAEHNRIADKLIEKHRITWRLCPEQDDWRALQLSAVHAS